MPGACFPGQEQSKENEPFEDCFAVPHPIPIRGFGINCQQFACGS
jgi:hypothetical protein